ncbi:MAG: ParB/RepB/Spo0J family partition protein [Acidimicrobiales bacterium]
MARRSGLGRGLGALIPPPTTEAGSAFQDLAVSAIQPSGLQPRTAFDEEPMAALTASVRELGVLQPVLVRPVGEGAYELIAGERRWRAAKRAGLPTIPAIIRTVGDGTVLEQALVENLQREDLNPMDEAAAYHQLIEDFGLTHEQVATRVGRSRAAISNTLRLFQLPPAVQRLVAEAKVSAGHARALLSTPDRTFQEALARRIVSESLSVRAAEDAVRSHHERGGDGAQQAKGGGRRLRPPGLLELEELLAARLDTRVRVDMTANKGRVIIEFATLEDLERIYRAMVDPG